MTDRTVLITGGTGGLGREAARAVAAQAQDHTVLITGRNPTQATSLAAELSEDTGGPVLGMVLDLASLADVRRFVADLRKRLRAGELSPLRAVVCNAGIQTISGTVLTVDGVEQTFGVNHLAHFLLIHELLPHLAEPARIVFVASDTHDPANRTGMPSPAYTDARSLAHPPTTDGQNASIVGRRCYTTSKLCNVLTTYELARRLAEQARDVTVNAFDPGLMPGTGLARDYGRLPALAWRYLLPALTVVPGVNAHTPRRSGRALARLVLDPGLAGTSGRYFSGMRETRSSVDSYDREKARDLWDTSMELLAT